MAQLAATLSCEFMFPKNPSGKLPTSGRAYAKQQSGAKWCRCANRAPCHAKARISCFRLIFWRVLPQKHHFFVPPSSPDTAVPLESKSSLASNHRKPNAAADKEKKGGGVLSLPRQSGGGEKIYI